MNLIGFYAFAKIVVAIIIVVMLLKFGDKDNLIVALFVAFFSMFSISAK